MAKTKKVTTVPYDDFLDEQLKDREFAASFLSACFEDRSPEGKTVFFNALMRVIRIHGIGKTAEKANIKRGTLNKLLGHKNPTLDSLVKVMGALDMELQLKTKRAI